MLFNSLVFIGFFLLVYTIYLLLTKHYRAQNVLLLISSYFFYAWWDWRFVSLLAVVTLVNFFAGKRIAQSRSLRARQLLVAISIFTSLSILGFFKYFNFFAESFLRIMNSLGFHFSDVTLNVLLPIGISFYTFQAMGYTIDVYRGRLRPATSFLDFALFVSFFPQLVAGPIERAAHLLPQISSPRNIEARQVDAGIFLILWGFFKKMVIADNLGLLVADPIFNGYTQYEGVDVLIGMLAFAGQIYCDFSAYSDIARGLSKLMGFDLIVNFKLPYLALNPRDFWSRWHISLSTWLRDYLYIPLGGNRKGKFNTYRNLSLTMLLGGLWHGAAWNYAIWGAYHGAIMTIYRLLSKDRKNSDTLSRRLSYVRILPRMLLMFFLTIIGWTIFRSTSVGQMFYMLSHVSLSSSEHTLNFGYDLLFFSTPLIAVQIYQYATRDLLAPAKLNPWIRVPIYSFMLTWILVFGVRESMEFIYFQF